MIRAAVTGGTLGDVNMLFKRDDGHPRRHFALFPVRVEGGTAWLETVIKVAWWWEIPEKNGERRYAVCNSIQAGGQPMWTYKRLLILAFVLLATPALAQTPPPPNPAELLRFLTVLEDQRNAAQNAEVRSRAKAMELADEVAKLKAQVEELQKKKAAD